MSGVTVDASQLGRLVADMTAGTIKAQAGVYGVTKKAAQNVKDGMVADASGIDHAPHFPASISYDVLPMGLRGIAADIGPDKDKRQGALGNILAFGTSKNGPVWNHAAALEREAPRYEAALATLAARVLG